MPYVCTGNLGPRYQYGQLAPEAESWAPHIRAMHISSGALSFLDDANAGRVLADAANRRRKSTLKRLGRQAISLEGAARAAHSRVASLTGELAAAQKALEAAKLAADEVLAAMAAEEQLLIPESAPPAGPARPQIQIIAKPPKPDAAPGGEVKTGPTDEDLRKAIYAEIAAFGRKKLIEFAAAPKVVHDEGGRIIGSGYAIDLSDVDTKSKDDVVAAFIERRIAQIRAPKPDAAPGGEVK